MKDLLTEIKHRLVEELGVSDIVTASANEIQRLIIADSRTKPKAKHKNGNFTYDFCKAKVDVYYDLYYLNNEQEIKMLSLRPSRANKTDNGYMLYTTIFYIRSQNKYIAYQGGLQHELEHIYQMIQSGKYLLTPQSSKIYRTAIRLFTIGSPAEKLVGSVIYCNNKFEKDAIANGLYKLIMDNPNVDPYTTLEKTPHYRNIKKIKFNVIDNDNRQIIEPVVKKYFNKSYKWFYSMANKVVKSYINKIGKILTKAYNDIYKDKTPLDGGFIGGTDIEI